MNTQSVIMVQISERAWTLAALHTACLMARKMSAAVAPVKMIPVQHPAMLATEWGYMNFSGQDRADFADYQAMIEDYGIECTPLLFQYASLAEAIAQAAEYAGAQVVFARIPESRIPFWTKLQTRLLKRQFARQQCQWIQQSDDSAGILVPVPASDISSFIRQQTR